jgi:hypothetical protein
VLKKEYSCDICRGPVAKESLFGIYFIGVKTFDIRDASATDGVHICTGCMAQLITKAKPAMDRRQPPTSGEEQK